MRNSIVHLLSDEELVKALQNGDQQAMEGLYNRYSTAVFTKCRSFVKDIEQARDLAQDIMLRAFERIATYKGEAKFSTWLYCITYNYCIDQKRKSKNKYHVSISDHNSCLDAVDDTEQDEEGEDQLSEKLSRGMLAMNDDDRELLEQKYLQKRSLRDLQLMYNISSSAIKMRLKRARERAVFETANTRQAAA